MKFFKSIYNIALLGLYVIILFLMFDSYIGHKEAMDAYRQSGTLEGIGAVMQFAWQNFICSIISIYASIGLVLCIYNEIKDQNSPNSSFTYFNNRAAKKGLLIAYFSMVALVFLTSFFLIGTNAFPFVAATVKWLMVAILWIIYVLYLKKIWHERKLHPVKIILFLGIFAESILAHIPLYVTLLKNIAFLPRLITDMPWMLSPILILSYLIALGFIEKKEQSLEP